MERCHEGLPGKNTTGEGDRRPSPAEIALCAPWLERELALVQPRVVLLLGRLAIDRCWGPAPLHKAVGRVRRERDRMLVPLPHPSRTSRWLNEPAHRALFDRALRAVRRELRRLD